MSEIFDKAIARIKTLPAEEQDKAAHILNDYVESRQGTRLTEAQWAEVNRRRNDPHARLVSHEEAREFIKQLISK
jgi:C-terminal processing protease CtpA/Prc